MRNTWGTFLLFLFLICFSFFFKLSILVCSRVLYECVCVIIFFHLCGFMCVQISIFMQKYAVYLSFNCVPQNSKFEALNIIFSYFFFYILIFPPLRSLCFVSCFLSFSCLCLLCLISIKQDLRLSTTALFLYRRPLLVLTKDVAEVSSLSNPPPFFLLLLQLGEESGPAGQVLLRGPQH